MSRRIIFPRPLEYLMAVAEHGSFTRAAEAMHVSQPSLSQQIKQLEESLSIELLVRSGRKIALTNAGEIYLHHARRAYGEIDAGTRAIQEVQDLSRGSLQLGWTPITDYLACSLLEMFSQRYPGIKLNTLEMPADDIETAVASRRIDIGITFSPQLSPQPKDDDIMSTKLFQETLCFAVGNHHPRAGQKERMSAKEFGKQSVILLNSSFALRRCVDNYCLMHSVSPNIVIETDSLSVIIEIVQSGKYGTMLPKSIAQSQCGLSSVNLAPSLPSQSISLITLQAGYNSPATLAFSELAVDWSVNKIVQIPSRKRLCPFA